MTEQRREAQPDREPIDRLIRPFQLFAQRKISGAILLAAATVVAIVWANSPWHHVLLDILDTRITVAVGSFVVSKPLLLWINDGLMGIFFFVVGLEIKREIIAGELSSVRQAALPALAALGGMVVPALVYVAVTAGGEGSSGWGIPMATDIAFALGVLLLLGPRIPTALKVFLTALAIVDDIGAIVVIAVFYTDTIALGSLAIGGLLLLVSVAANLLGVRNAIIYFIVGTLVWLAFLKSGVHATLAAVLMAMTVPSRTRIDGERLVDRVCDAIDKLRASGVPRGKGLLTHEQQHAIHAIEKTLEDSLPPLQQLEHALMPLVTFLVMPVFALANAGVRLGSGLGDAIVDPVCIGVVLGLFIGKQVGIFGFAWLGVRFGIADLPGGVSWRQVHAVGVLAGIGFTMSLFIGGLAFTDPAQQEVAKVGILLGSIISGVVGSLCLLRCRGESSPPVSPKVG